MRGSGGKGMDKIIKKHVKAIKHIKYLKMK